MILLWTIYFYVPYNVYLSIHHIISVLIWLILYIHNYGIYTPIIYYNSVPFYWYTWKIVVYGLPYAAKQYIEKADVVWNNNIIIQWKFSLFFATVFYMAYYYIYGIVTIIYTALISDGSLRITWLCHTIILYTNNICYVM